MDLDGTRIRGPEDSSPTANPEPDRKKNENSISKQQPPLPTPPPQPPSSTTTTKQQQNNNKQQQQKNLSLILIPHLVDHVLNLSL